MQSVVESVTVYVETAEKFPIWWLINVSGVDKPVLLHQNWVCEHSELKAGDKVDYEIAGSTFNGYQLFDKLRAVKSEKNEHNMLDLMDDNQSTCKT